MTIAPSESEHLPTLAIKPKGIKRQVSVVDVVDAIGESVQDALRKVVLAYGRDCALDDADGQNLVEQVASLEAAKSAADERIALQALLIKKLKAELLREKSVNLELQKERIIVAPTAAPTKEEVLGRTSDAAAVGTTDPWDAIPKVLDTTTKTPALHGFRFYSATPVDDDDDADVDDRQESASPSPLSTSLRSSMMGQFLPASLLDSPCIAPATAATISIAQRKLDAFSLDKPDADEPLKERSSLGSRRTTSNSSNDDGSDDGSLESSVPASTVGLLRDLFDGVSSDELLEVLASCRGDVSKAMDHLLKTHTTFNPAPTPAVKPEFRPAAVPASSNWKTEMCMYYLQGKCNKTRRTCSFAHGESDLVRPSKQAPMPPLAPPTPGFKTRLCPQYLEGACPKPRRDCPLAHGESDLVFRDALPAAPPALATNPAPRLQNYKTELCYYFLKGCCNYSTDECRFAHGEADLRTVESNTMEWDMMLPAAALEYQLAYQQQALPTPPQPAAYHGRYMVKDEMAKRRVTLPARRDSLNHLPPATWSTPPQPYDY
ncbi:hypothetical protein ACHHYP_02790 [Achlya hypogyna]|uniref:C3H1-type domain-containing protein n=1 Tax=Achlya hypogyna TaxID=1202772 RepID=A0A1V9Z5K7_ACHHY|nr:hypothetical protein ACHHYP_02790 [Achlya hypogyna]